MTSAPLLSILIVNWNSGSLLRACLDSIPRAEIPLEIIVLDNGSTDDSAAMVRSQFPEVELIASPSNVGFAAANNRAAQRARGEYFLLLNPDTVIPSGTLGALVDFGVQRPTVGAVGPKLLNADGTHQRSCWRGYPGLGMALSDALFLWKIPGLAWIQPSEYRPAELRTARPVDHLLGACLLIRRAAWEQVGPLDERYFLFLEETDWCWRARRAGWLIYYLPDVSITHYGQQSMRLAPRRNVPQFYKSYIWFDRAHHRRAILRAAALKSIIAVACALRISMWQLRARRATDALARARAAAMATGYWQTLTELTSY